MNMNQRIVRHRRNLIPFANGLLILLLLATGTSQCAASIWYVNNQVGQDTNKGLTQNVGPEGVGPFRTIQHALNRASTADTIVIANTGIPYNEFLSLAGPQNSGLAGLPFRIIGNGAILSGIVTTPARDWELVSSDLFRFRPESGAHQQLYLGKRPAKFHPMVDQDLKDLPPRGWTLQGGYIYFKSDPGMLPDAYALGHSAHQTGITLYAVKFVAIENLVVQGFYLDGVNAHDNVKSSQLVGVTSRGNGRSGVSVGGCSELSLNSCLLGDNLHHQLRTESVAQVELAGCSLLENSLGPTIDRQGGEITESASVEQPAIPQGGDVNADQAVEPAESPAPSDAPTIDNDDPFAG